MVDPINSLDAPRNPEVEIEVEAEIARRDEEILRLRDLLIARDAELGALKGRLKIIEDHAERMSRLVARIPIPGFAWFAGALLRLLRAGRG